MTTQPTTRFQPSEFYHLKAKTPQTLRTFEIDRSKWARGSLFIEPNGDGDAVATYVLSQVNKRHADTDIRLKYRLEFSPSILYPNQTMPERILRVAQDLNEQHDGELDYMLDVISRVAEPDDYFGQWHFNEDVSLIFRVGDDSVETDTLMDSREMEIGDAFDRVGVDLRFTGKHWHVGPVRCTGEGYCCNSVGPYADEDDED